VSVNRWLDEYPAFIWLSDLEWNNAKHKHQWECVFGHKTQRTFDSIKSALQSGKNACKKCNVRYRGEEMLRFAMEAMTGELFPKTRPKWLINPDTETLLELDGYSETLKLAFEFDGRQHDEHVVHFQPKVADFKNQQRRDQIKESLCDKHGVTLIRVKEQDNILCDPDGLVSKIKSVRPEVVKNVNIDWKSFEPNNRYDLLEKAKEHAAKYNGRCNSKVILSPSDRVEFFCPEHDYVWSPKYSVAIERDQWCKHCGHEVRAKKQSRFITNEQIKKICEIAKPPISFLDWAGEDDKGRHLWECGNIACEFPFKMSALDLVQKIEKGKNPCPSCNKRRRISLWEVHRYAELKGGLCLTFDDTDKVMFKCHNQGHPQFTLSKSQVKGGVWCKLCPDRKKQKLPIEMVQETAKHHGYKLVGKYVNNHSSLELECLKCGQSRNDINYRQLEHAKATGSQEHSCDHCRPLSNHSPNY